LQLTFNRLETFTAGVFTFSIDAFIAVRKDLNDYHFSGMGINYAKGGISLFLL